MVLFLCKHRFKQLAYELFVFSLIFFKKKQLIKFSVCFRKVHIFYLFFFFASKKDISIESILSRKNNRAMRLNTVITSILGITFWKEVDISFSVRSIAGCSATFHGFVRVPEIIISLAT